MLSINIYAWIGFSAFILLMVVYDAGLIKIGNQSQQMTRGRAIKSSCVWLGLSGIFAGVIYVWQGPQAALEYCSGYIIEKTLSLDNIFIFIVIFAHFSIPLHFQHRILTYGVLSAIIMRGVFIAIGITLIEAFNWIFYIFGAILVFTAIKMLIPKPDDHANDLNQNKTLNFLRKHIPLSHKLAGQNFFIKENNKWLATPLLLVLVFIEFSDILFAFDSIPAIFAITRDPFIVFSSNIFAIMGLRALYFVLVDLIKNIYYLNYGIGSILLFVGIKLLLTHTYEIPIGISLATIIGLLTITTVASVLKKYLDRQKIRLTNRSIQFIEKIE